MMRIEETPAKVTIHATSVEYASGQAPELATALAKKERFRGKKKVRPIVMAISLVRLARKRGR